MKIAIARENVPDETRVAMLPKTVAKLLSLGATVEIESGLGEPLLIPNEEYEKQGATIQKDRKKLLSSADMVLQLHKPLLKEIPLFKEKCIHISFLDPFHEKTLILEMKKHNITSISMEMMPRTTIAQKMDALSSQANLAGYVAVMLAAQQLNKILPMMTTPAGTLQPARVFIIGVGVAGLQAIATARRLGARVEAFDTRPIVEEQVKSLGAKFIKIDLGDTGQTQEGYAKALTEEQLKKQKEEMAKICMQSDIVITTAQVFGRKAPIILTKNMIKEMKPNSVIVDMAVDSGGNVEGSKLNEVVIKDGIKIIGISNLAREVPLHASEMYVSNLYNFLNHFWDKEKKLFQLDFDNELIKSSVVTHNKNITNEKIQKIFEQGE